MEIQVKNDSQEQRSGWWKWSVWLEGPDEELDQIDSVVYILHSTFKEPVQRVSNRMARFRLRGSSWGEFNIYLKIHLKDGQVVERQHWLSLDPQAATRRGPARGLEASQKPRLYLSTAASDALFADALQEALEEQGIETVVSHDLGAGQQLDSLLASGREHFDAGLFIASEVRNPWLGREIVALQSNKIPLIAVQVGFEPRLPEELKDAPTYHIKDLSEAEMVAHSIAERIRDQLE